MEELLAQSQFESLIEGSIIKGIITEIRENDVILDIGAKAEGVVPAHEFFDIGELQVGEEIEVFLDRLEDRDGNPVVSYDKAQQKKNWENILSQCEEGSILSWSGQDQGQGGSGRQYWRRCLPSGFSNRHPAAQEPGPVCWPDL
jgi:small subunit ribosomal protein S1